MAPEIISGKGYSFSADYWSFGITLFEIFYDYLPFGQGAREILDIYQQILGKKLKIQLIIFLKNWKNIK